MLIDSHCHLTNERFRSDVAAVLERAQTAGVGGFLSIGTGIEDARATHALAKAHPGVIWATAGLDPFSAHACGDQFAAELSRLSDLLTSGGFVAVGECGLEHHHELAASAVQREHFAAQINLAITLDLPLIIHARSGARGGDAHIAAIDILRAHPKARGVIHSFDGNTNHAKSWLDVGFHIAINGMVTFKPNQALRDAVRVVPMDKLLVETDAPYLAPVPHRGRRCEPAHAMDTARFIAELRGERCEDLCAWATRNAQRLLSLNNAIQGNR